MKAFGKTVLAYLFMIGLGTILSGFLAFLLGLAIWPLLAIANLEYMLGVRVLFGVFFTFGFVRTTWTTAKKLGLLARNGWEFPVETIPAKQTPAVEIVKVNGTLVD